VAIVAHGRGAAETVAARLGVSPRTVSYRIQEAEGLLGCSVTSRRTELDVAVRLESALADTG
jgi:DNA-binding transcriptional LysR family regulator